MRPKTFDEDEDEDEVRHPNRLAQAHALMLVICGYNGTGAS
jgi:hypothetical protein